MKSTITRINALKFYKQRELINCNRFYQRKLSKDIDALAYNEMVKRLHNKHFVLGCFSSTPLLRKN